MQKKWALHPTLIDFSEGRPIQIMRVGKWHFQDYGEVDVTKKTISNIVTNFNQNVRGQKIPINIEHVKHLGKIGFIKSLHTSNDGNELYAIPEWTDRGQELVKEQSFAYTSPEYYMKWEDPEKRRSYNDVLSGLALTNYPRFKGMEEIAASDNEMFFAAECRDTEIDPVYISDNLSFCADNTITDNIEIMTILLATEDDNGKVKYTPQSVRDSLPESAFAFVSQRKILINHRGNVQAGIARFMQVQGVSDEERDTAWGRLKRAASKFGLTAPDSWHDIGKSSEKTASERRTIFTVEREKPMDVITHTDIEKQFSEVQAQLADAVKKLEASEANNKLFETRLAEMSEMVKQQQAAIEAEHTARVDVEVRTRLESAKVAGRITPAQQDMYMAELPKMAESQRELWFKDIDTRPVVIHFGEDGSGADGDGDVDMENTALAKQAKQIQGSDSAKKMSYREALTQARAEMKK